MDETSMRVYRNCRWVSAALVALLCLALLLFAGCGGPASDGESAAFSGSGTATDPWQIGSVDDLLALAAAVNDGSAAGYAGQYLKLTADLDLTDVEWTPIGSMADAENGSTFFAGEFDGGGHAIAGLTYETDENIIGAGLFGINVGVVKNVELRDARVVVRGGEPVLSQAIGALVGYNMGGQVDHCSLSGESYVYGLNCVGGLVGGSGGVVTNCTVEGVTVEVFGDNDFSEELAQCDVNECGGLVVGGAFGGTVSACTASGTVRSEGMEPVGLGGIAGCLEMMDLVADNVVDVVIETTQGGHAIGGLCGYAGTVSVTDTVLEETGVTVNSYPGMIRDCQVKVEIRAPGATHVGGIVGTNLYYFGEESLFDLENCTVVGSIDGAVTPGMVAGRATAAKLSNIQADVEIDGTANGPVIGKTDRLYMSLDQFEPGSEEEARQVLKSYAGTYDPLFQRILAPEYDQIWQDCCVEFAGAEAAAESATMLRNACVGELYGEAAEAAYGDGSQGAQFRCDFLGTLAQITFDGARISGTDSAGNQVFSHTYSYYGYDEEFGFYEFKSDDGNEDEYAYFFLLPDSPAKTFHVEFRFGADPEQLAAFYTGDYAYWLAAGMLTDADEDMIENCIRLFCKENLTGE